MDQVQSGRSWTITHGKWTVDLFRPPTFTVLFHQPSLAVYLRLSWTYERPIRAKFAKEDLLLILSGFQLQCIECLILPTGDANNFLHHPQRNSFSHVSPFVGRFGASDIASAGSILFFLASIIFGPSESDFLRLICFSASIISFGRFLDPFLRPRFFLFWF